MHLLAGRIKMKYRSIAVTILVAVFAIAANAQNTQFTYQGSLKDGAAAANGNYDFQVGLFQTALGGTALATQEITNVPVANGIFTLVLDFGLNFSTPGARRLEISARPVGSPTYTILTPRQPVLSVPYAMKSIDAANAVSANTATVATTANNALALGGTAANQYVLTTDTRMTDARNPLPGSDHYIQNTNNQQSADFNIDGNGMLAGTLTAGDVSAGTVSATGALSGSQVNIGANRVLYASNIIPQLLVVGLGAGTNTTGTDNTFFGNGAGQLTTTGGSNSFFGRLAGNSNTASSNSFFGTESGFGNTSGTRNAYFGFNTGRNNQTANDNTHVGYRAGFFNTASSNSFFGSGAGDSATTGALNTFVGHNAGTTINTGASNSALGASADFSSGALSNATAIGARALATQSNTMVLGAINGVNGATANTNVGIGTSAPTARLEVNGGGGNALAITNGGIKVTGAGLNTNTTVFIMAKTAANTCGGSGGLQTAINNPFANGDPSAILFVTPKDAVARSFSVRYVTAASAPPACPFLADRWSILAGTNSFNDNDEFNIMVVKP